MLVLFDQNVPAPLRQHLKRHDVVESFERGWARLSNGALLDSAEQAGFEVFVTADKNIRYQQKLAGRKIAIVVIGNAQWRALRRHAQLVVSAIDGATPGSYIEVDVPAGPD